MRYVLFIVLCVAVSGCGPLVSPMIPRLTAEDQHKVDQVWDNLLTPPQRVDRQTLLDVNVAYWLYTLGVDRFHMTSEKYFSGGIVVMQIDCDRANPDSDEFSITVLDRRGRMIRRERYSRADVDDSSKMVGAFPFNDALEHKKPIDAQITIEIGKPTTEPATQPVTQPTTRALTPEEQHLLAEMERRRFAVIAATQPARVTPLQKSK